MNGLKGAAWVVAGMICSLAGYVILAVLLTVARPHNYEGRVVQQSEEVQPLGCSVETRL